MEEDKSIKIHFESRNRLYYTENGIKFTMTMTKDEKDVLYFGCIKRSLSSSNKQKCGATGIYKVQEKEYIRKRPHISGCGATLSNTKIIDSYQVQRDFLENKLKENPKPTPAPGLELLLKENWKNDPEAKFIPLNYRQVKHIINSYKEDNNIHDLKNSEHSIILTRDNSLFQRFNSSFITLPRVRVYKSLVNDI